MEGKNRNNMDKIKKLSSRKKIKSTPYTHLEEFALPPLRVENLIYPLQGYAVVESFTDIMIINA